MSKSQSSRSFTFIQGYLGGESRRVTAKSRGELLTALADFFHLEPGAAWDFLNHLTLSVWEGHLTILSDLGVVIAQGEQPTTVVGFNKGKR